jgi:rod shape-determining protein MreC
VKNKGLITWLIIIAGVLVLLNLPGAFSRRMKASVREAIAPLQEVLSTFGVRVQESVASFRGLGGMLQDNRELAEEIIRLRTQLRTLETVENENIRLRAQLHFAQRSSRGLIPCQVIGRDVSGWWRTVRLGCGTRDGVLPDSAVITSEGLVGRTTEVSRRVSDVLLISDPACRVSVQITRTGAHGILEGTGSPFDGHAQCRMQFINKDIAVRPGDEIVTSGLGGVFPQGILVGYVEKIYMDEAGLYQYADVIPKADMGMLTYVFVISEEEDEVAELLREKGPIRREEIEQ